MCEMMYMRNYSDWGEADSTDQGLDLETSWFIVKVVG